MKIRSMIAATIVACTVSVPAMADYSRIEDDVRYCNMLADATAAYKSRTSPVDIITGGVDVLSDIFNGRDAGYAVRSETRRAEREYRSEQRQKRRVFNACMSDMSKQSGR